MAPSSSRRRRQADGDSLEEGEFHPGYSSSSSDDYSLDQSRREEETRPPQLCRRLEEILARAPAAMLPSYEGESDWTIVGEDDYSHTPASFVSAGVEAPTYSCRVCGKGFGSSKAVDGDGHMRVHNPRESRHGKEYLAVNPGWAITGGKRGWTGSKGKAVVSSSEEANHCMPTTVVSEPNRPSQPIALPLLARSNLSSSMASARTNLESGETSSPPSIHDEAGVSVAGANPPEEAFVHQQLPQLALQLSQVAFQLAQVALQLAPAVPAPAQGPAAPQRDYNCKICGKSFPTPQGLGGHAAGHMNKQIREAEAAAGFGQDGNAIPEAARNDVQDHKCQKCYKVFGTGVALGGHMRLHYKGQPVVHRKSKKWCVAPPPPLAAPLTSPTVCMADPTLKQGIKTGQPSHSSPPAASRLRLFGIDIYPPAAEAPAVQEGTDIRPQVEVPEVQEGTDTTPHAGAPHQEGSAMTTKGSASTGGQRQDENVEKQI